MSAKDVDAIRDFKEQKLDNEFVRKVTRSLKISLATIRVRIRSKIWGSSVVSVGEIPA